MFQAGQKIGVYTLVRKLAEGGFGEVWLAEKRSEFVTKKVAVKLPHDEDVDFESIRQEAYLWEQASGHPNVLPLIDADVYDGQVAIVSEFAEDGSLADRLKIERKLSIREAVEMTIGILNGLEYLHSKGIVHRDIKPANILLQGNTPRLADFGISRAVETSTISSVIVGTESYMSPEAFEGVRSVQTDVWSVGVVLYKLLTGNLPFPQTKPTEMMYAILMKEPEPLPEEIPPQLQKVVFQALEKDRETSENPPRRYQSAAAMREDLKVFLENIASAVSLSPENDELTRQIPGDESTIVRIPVSIENARKKSPRDFLQNLSNLKLSPLAGLSVMLGLAAVALLSFYLFNRTFSSEAQTPDITNQNIVAANEMPVNQNVSATNANNAAEASRSAFDYFTEANKLFERKRYDRAIDAYTKAIEINPTDFSFYNNRGIVYHTRKKYAEAIADFSKAVELNPNSSFTYSNRGVAYEDSGNIEQAINDYRKAVELDPNDAKARNNLNKILK
jgi:serine/threonine-protein kinase